MLNGFLTIGGARFGVTHDLVLEGDDPYLERWILWFGFTLRVHKFHKGDDERAFHDHPWWFLTFPLNPYRELTPELGVRDVKPFRFHFRPAHHQHIVQLLHGKPVWTLILTGPKSKEWGFWEDGEFIHHERWLQVINQEET